MSYKRIAVKVGSNVLTKSDGRLDITRVSSIVDQIAVLHHAGIEVILISSGAVASGRGEIQPTKKLDEVSARQLFSAVGQAKLINRYYEFFKEQGIICGQVLTTKENFSSRSLYLNQQNCIQVMLQNRVIPIVNENDTTSVTELMFTDNDELSGLIATMMDVEALIILSNVDGLFDGHPNDPQSQLIREVQPDDTHLATYISDHKSSLGRGGMGTKCSIAQKVASEGITVMIANGRRENVLIDLTAHPKNVLHTHFFPSVKPVSGIKKWIAHSEDFAKGVVKLNDGAVAALLDPSKAASLLPVGIVAIEGDFDADDIVRLTDQHGITIGVGKAQYDASTVRALMGQKGQKPFIHYDYLMLG
ncbi:MAG: glutamate 5-kinase [Microbacter sp.]